MFLRFFSKDTAGSAIRIILLFFVIWVLSSPGQTEGVSLHGNPDMPFYSFIAEMFDGKSRIVPAIIAFVLFLSQAFLLIRLNVRHILMQERSFLPGLFFLLIPAVYLPSLQFSPAVFGVFFLIIILDLLLGVDRQDEESMIFFNAGLILGISSLFYAPSVYFLVFVWILAAVLRSFFWRDYLLPLLGAAVPFGLYSGISYLLADNPTEIFTQLREGLTGNTAAIQTDWMLIVLFGFLAIILLISSIYMLGVFQFRKIYIRNYYLVLFWLFLLSAGVFFITGREKGILLFLAIPMSFLFSNYFVNSRKTRINTLILAAFILALVSRGLSDYFGWFL